MSVSISGDGALTGIDQGLNVVGVLTASGGFSGNLTGNVTGTVNSSGIATFTSGIVVSAGSTSAPSISPSGDSNTGIFFPSADTVCIGEGGVESLRVDSSSNIGIGTVTPSEKTHIYGTGDIKLLVETPSSGLNANAALVLKSLSEGHWAVQTGNAVSGGLRIYDRTADLERFRINSSGHTLPGADNTYDLGASGTRWRNIYTADLQMSNEGSQNDIDGTWGAYTIQEGENDLFLINRRTGKKYKFLLEEVK